MAGPDYHSLERLHAAPSLSQMFQPEAIVIGIGPLGRAVTERLAEELPDRPDNVLLSVGITGMEIDSGLLLPRPDSHLKGSEKLNLGAGYSSGERDRSDCRSRLLIDLGFSNPAVWDSLQKMAAKLPAGTFGGIWLVASLFDVVGSGLIFDLAYLARLVSRNQNRHPSINWLVALPTAEWGDEYLNVSGAALREVKRLMDGNSPERLYEYAANSSNTDLRKHLEKGELSISQLFLCYPSDGSFGQEAGREVIEQMVILLKPLLQPNGWPKIRDSLGSKKQGNVPHCTLFAGQAHTIPLQLLQEWVRTQLAASVLANESQGMFPGRFQRIANFEEDTALTVLEQSSDDFLKQVAYDARNRTRTHQWPSAQKAAASLVETLRNQLEEQGSSLPPAQLFLTAKALIAALQSILSRSSGPQSDLDKLQSTLREVAKEVDAWQRWGGTIAEESERKLSEIRLKWQRQDPPGWVRLVNDRTLDPIMGQFKTDEFIRRWQQYIRWAWITSGSTLQLRIDTLFPDYESRHYWRHQAGKDIQSLWNGVYEVMAALTGDLKHWPTSVHLQDGANLSDVAGNLDLMGKYDNSKAAGKGAISRWGFQISGDAAWRDRRAFPAGVVVERIDNGTAVEGFLLLLHAGVPIASLQLNETLMKQYWLRRSAEFHLFEPEKQAVAIEKAALDTLSRRERREMPGLQLSSSIVGLMQWLDWVKIFVWAWQLGWVTPALGGGHYQLKMPNTIGTPPLNWQAPTSCSHIIEALKAFVLSNKEMIVQNSLIQQVRQALKQSVEVGRDVESGNPGSTTGDIDWWLLVRGIKDS